LAVKDSFTSLEVDIPGPEGESVQGFSRVEGKELSFTLRWVEFPRWTFFPAVKMFFLPPIAYGTAPDSQEGEPDGSSSAEVPPLTTVLRAARQVGLLTLREEIVERSGLIPLKAYGLFYHEISNGFSIRPLGDFH